MQIQTIKSQYDSNMQSIEMTDNVLKNLIESVKTPLVVENKETIPQWKFCTVKGKKRCTDNMDSTNILILDFDDAGYSYQEFENQFREFKYILHTSYSYNGQNSKFRVLLFLDKEYEINRMFCKIPNEPTFSPYHYLLNYFKHVDPASFVKAQFFKVPAKSSKTAPYYFNLHNGREFILDKDIEGYYMAYNRCLDKEKEQAKQRQIKAAVLKTQMNGDLTKAIEYVKRKMEQAPPGMRHNAIFGLAAWYSKCGGDYATFSQIRPTWADKKYDNQIKRLEKEWDKIGK